jgi:hypothetical protein
MVTLAAAGVAPRELANKVTPAKARITSTIPATRISGRERLDVDGDFMASPSDGG